MNHVAIAGTSQLVAVSSRILARLPALGRPRALPSPTCPATVAESCDLLIRLQSRMPRATWLSEGHPGRLSFVDAAMWQLTGAQVGQHFQALVDADDVSRIEQACGQLMSRGHVRFEFRVRSPGGAGRWLQCEAVDLTEPGDAVRHWGGAVWDALARAGETPETLETHADDCDSTTQDRLAELELRNQELDAFARTAAHDLRSPLSSIVGFVQLLRLRYGAKLGADGLRMTELVDSSAREMIQLVDDLLALSRATAVELQREPVDLGAMAHEIIARLRTIHPGRHVAVEIAGHLEMRADRGLAASLLANLIGNAWKYTGKTESAMIRIGCDPSGDVPRITIDDNGAGFDVHAAGKLFQPFQRFHTASEFDGTGIGLATCQRIVQRHGGIIDITSAPGRGTRVAFTLSPPSPVEVLPAVAPASEPASCTPARAH